jgi:hypothetical protein
VSVIGYDPWFALVAPDTWTLPEALRTSSKPTKLGMVPESSKVTAYAQFGTLITVNAVKNGCISIPTLVTMRLGKPVKIKLVTSQTTVILNTT